MGADGERVGDRIEVAGEQLAMEVGVPGGDGDARQQADVDVVDHGGARGDGQGAATVWVAAERLIDGVDAEGKVAVRGGIGGGGEDEARLAEQVWRGRYRPCPGQSEQHE